MLNRGGRTITSICEEDFVLLGTGAKWISEAQGKTDRSNRKSSRISVQAQIKAVNDTTNLKDEELGLYLRREGLYSTQIEEWRIHSWRMLYDGTRSPLRMQETLKLSNSNMKS